MNRQTTVQTIESPFTQGHFHLCPAVATPLTTSSCLSIFNNLSPAHYCFIGEHLEKTSPRRIVYMLSETVISHHPTNIKLLNSNYRKLLDNHNTLLMQEVSSLIKNLLMDSGNSKFGFSSVTTSFFLSAQSSLKSFQSLFTSN